MFGTLRIGSDTNSVEFIEHAKGEAAIRLGGYIFSHSACENCRLKKLRCSGHKSGCDRCRSQGLKCSYQTTPESNSSTNTSRPKSRSRSHFQASFSNTSGTASGTSNAPGPLDNTNNNVSVDQDLGGWEMAETDIATTTSQFSRDLNHVNQGEHSNHLNNSDLRDGLRFPGDLDDSENDLDDLFSNIAGLQPDDMQTNVSMLEGLGDIDIVASQPASVDAQSSFMTFEHVRTSPSSSSRSDDFVPTSFGRARSRTIESSSSSSCQCRSSILRILAEIESNILSASPNNMYAILSYQRRTLAASNGILTSRICNCRMKFFGLVEIIAEKMTRLSEAILTAFVCRMKERNDDVDFGESDSHSPEKRLDRNSAIRLGEFQVQTLQEFKVVSAAVIKLQLKYSVTFVSRTRELAISMNRLAQAQSLKKLESRLKELFVKMQRMASDIESNFCDI